MDGHAQRHLGHDGFDEGDLFDQSMSLDSSRPSMISIAWPKRGLDTAAPAAVAVKVDYPDAGGSDSYVVDFRGLKGSPARREQQSQFYRKRGSRARSLNRLARAQRYAGKAGSLG